MYVFIVHKLVFFAIIIHNNYAVTGSNLFGSVGINTEKFTSWLKQLHCACHSFFFLKQIDIPNRTFEMRGGMCQTRMFILLMQTF